MRLGKRRHVCLASHTVSKHMYFHWLISLGALPWLLTASLLSPPPPPPPQLSPLAVAVICTHACWAFTLKFTATKQMVTLGVLR